MPPRSSKGSKAQNAINPRIKQTTLKNFIVVKAPVAGGSSAAVAANAPQSGAASAAQAAATAGSSNRAGRENVPLNPASPAAGSSVDYAISLEFSRARRAGQLKQSPAAASRRSSGGNGNGGGTVWPRPPTALSLEHPGLAALKSSRPPPPVGWLPGALPSPPKHNAPALVVPESPEVGSAAGGCRAPAVSRTSWPARAAGERMSGRPTGGRWVVCQEASQAPMRFSGGGGAHRSAYQQLAGDYPDSDSTSDSTQSQTLSSSDRCAQGPPGGATSVSRPNTAVC